MSTLTIITNSQKIIEHFPINSYLLLTLIMCGIFGYIGKRDARKTVIEGLKRLEYRGYDSWGVATVHEHGIDVSKTVGAIGEIPPEKAKDTSYIGVGHTRWATHGGVTEINAHPHASTDKSFVLAQNGIVENYQELKQMLLEKKYKFISETDTEVIVHLIEEKLKTEKDLLEAVRMAFLDLEGRNTIIVLTADGNRIIAVRNGSPLVVGMGDGEYFFASDTLSFADKTNKVVFMDDYQMAEYNLGKIHLYDAPSGKELKIKITELSHDDVTIDTGGFPHFMIKEIVEQKHTIREAVQYTEAELEPLVKAIKTAKTVYTIGAGTAGFAAGEIAYFLRKYANIQAVELKSYEVDSYKHLFSKQDILLVISQSGETADTIQAVEIAKKQGTKIASLVNMVGSTITRISDYPYFSRSGPEICVASTKAFTAQIAWGLLLANTVAGKYDVAKKEIIDLSKTLESYFSDDLFEQIKKLVVELARKQHFFVLGKGQNYYIALEGALKVKEITYKHFEGFAAGELKHGVIALVEKGTPVFCIISEDENKNDILNAAAQVKARGAWTIGISKQKNELFDDTILTPEFGMVDPLVNVIPFQLISYFMGTYLGYSPDKPRNLAKSVTVK